MTSLEFQVPTEHPSFPDHFPGQPVVPGVVLLEQILAACKTQGIECGEIKQCKFLRPVLPGQSGWLEVETTSAGDVAVTLTLAEEVKLSAKLGLRDQPQP